MEALGNSGETAWSVMRIANAALAAALLGLAACATHETVTVSQTPSTPGHSATAVQRSAAPTPAVTKTVVKYRNATPTAAAPTTTAPTTAAAAAPAPAPAAAPNVTDPWAVVSAYYGDIESGDYQDAWQLLDSGMTTDQTYQQFVDGFNCTGSQDLSENWESGDEVNFDLAATDDCSGAVQDFSGTDSVVNGQIVAADISADS
jgi:curli biogenesis system outer membrane secretion channel CsgG